MDELLRRISLADQLQRVVTRLNSSRSERALAVIDRLAASYLVASQEASEETRRELQALAAHYATSAELLARGTAFSGNMLPIDVFPEDDGTVDFVIARNIHAPESDVDIGGGRATYPWADMFSDPNCGVFLVCGQSNAANHGATRYTACLDVFALNCTNLRCFAAADPLPGASGSGGSIWSRLGDLLITRGLYRRVLFIPVAFGGTFIREWHEETWIRMRLALVLGRLRKRLAMSAISFNAVLWQQGEAEANNTDMSADQYRFHLKQIVASLREMGVFSPVLVACATVCETGERPFQNHAAIREAQRTAEDPSLAIFAGPDIDIIGPSARYDGCHFAESALNDAAELWATCIAQRHHLLSKPSVI